MFVRKAYRFRLEPDAAQRQSLGRFAGSCRYAWNRALAEQKARIAAGERTAGYASMCRWLTAWRHDESTAWLANTHSSALQQKLKDLDRAIRDAFRQKGDTAQKRFPRFKKRGRGDSFRYPASVKASAIHAGWGRVWLPKIGWLKYRASRPIEGQIAQATVVENAGHWYVAIQTQREIAEPEPATNAVGIDLGVVTFAALSDGTMIRPLNAFHAVQRRLRRAQRKLARKRRHSQNWRRQIRRIARIRAREADARRDFLHKVSTTIAKNHGIVVMEDLAVSRM